MKNFFVHTLRIVSGVALPIGTLFFALFLISFLTKDLPLNGVWFYIPIILIFFVFPLLAILFLHTHKRLDQAIDGTQIISENKIAFFQRPINNLIPIVVLITIGLIPIFYLILFAIRGLSD